MTTFNKRLRILYDPISYMPGWKSLDQALPAHVRSALNQALIIRHGLPSLPVSDDPPDHWAGRMVRDWDAIPAAAYLMACSLLRERLVCDRLFLSLEPEVHSFLQFDFPRVELGHERWSLSRDALVQIGGACLLHMLPKLPLWLARRIEVRFTPAQPGAPDLRLTPQDLTRFSMALAHAQKDPGFFNSFRS